jgi:uncharacterized protein (DUF1330 family)
VFARERSTGHVSLWPVSAGVERFTARVHGMAVLLSVLLWARPGGEDLLFEYEDQVLALLDRHRGRLLSRVRAIDGGPCEIHLLEFATDQALVDYQNDPDRLALSAMRDQAIERTEVIRVRHISAPG